MDVMKCKCCGGKPTLKMVVDPPRTYVYCNHCPGMFISKTSAESITRWNSANGGPLIGNEPFYVHRELMAWHFVGPDTIYLFRGDGGFHRRKTNQIKGI